MTRRDHESESEQVTMVREKNVTDAFFAILRTLR